MIAKAPQVPDTTRQLYTPFLHLRWMEMLALRDIRTTLSARTHTVPILIPADKLSPSDARTLAMMHEVGVAAGIVQNPPRKKRSGSVAALQKLLSRAMAEHPTLEPAWLVDSSTTSQAIAAMATRAAGARCWLVYSASTDASTIGRIVTAKGLSGAYHIIPEPAPAPGAALLGLPGDRLVLRGDGVRRAQNSASYPPETVLPDVHRVARVNRWRGFADYTMLASSYRPGGARPQSMCLHATFARPTGSGLGVDDLVVCHAHGTGLTVEHMVAAAQLRLYSLPDVAGALTQTYGGDLLLTARQNAPGPYKRYAVAHHVEFVSGLAL